MRPVIGSATTPRRTPRTLDEAFGWRAPLHVPRRRRRLDGDGIAAIVAAFVAAFVAVAHYF